MKSLSWTSPLLAALLVAGTASRAHANLFTDNFQALIVAEKAKDAPAELCKPCSYVAFDGGFIEAGDPIAGDTEPTPEQVRQDLTSALASQGFQDSKGSPALVIIYHWGVLRPDHLEIKVPYEIRKNLSARLNLVSTRKMDAEIENLIRDREQAGGQDLSAASPRFLVPPLDTVVAHARLPRIFVVVSAYDYQALSGRHEAKLVWRAKLSAQETSGDMLQVIPPLISKGAPYFGQDLAEVPMLDATLEAHPAAAPDSFKFQPTPETFGLDRQLLLQVIRHERARISGYAED